MILTQKSKVVKSGFRIIYTTAARTRLHAENLKPGVYPLRQRYVSKVGDYDSDNILYSEGYAMGNTILFDSRHYVMPVEEFKTNFEPMGGKE